MFWYIKKRQRKNKSHEGEKIIIEEKSFQKYEIKGEGYQELQ